MPRSLWPGCLGYVCLVLLLVLESGDQRGAFGECRYAPEHVVGFGVESVVVVLDVQVWRQLDLLHGIQGHGGTDTLFVERDDVSYNSNTKCQTQATFVFIRL